MKTINITQLVTKLLIITVLSILIVVGMGLSPIHMMTIACANPNYNNGLPPDNIPTVGISGQQLESFSNFGIALTDDPLGWVYKYHGDGF